jgi:hypothetical protein
MHSPAVAHVDPEVPTVIVGLQVPLVALLVNHPFNWNGK